MRSFLISLVFLFITLACFSQDDTITLTLLPTFNGKPLELNKVYLDTVHQDSITISDFRFYVSNITLSKNGYILHKDTDQFFLIDASIEGSNILCFTTPESNFDEIRFDLGIDSTTNMAGAHGGALDPTTGMYWTWQSGYINFKLEGTSFKCSARNREFQFHIGGYQFPNATLQHIRLKAYDDVSATIDIGKLMEQTDLMLLNQIMTPGDEANKFADRISKTITSKR